ncbi:Protein SCO1 homolog, mitochondrial [Strongyloides ratti]|uniref:Protein SCO1 homolog, mitochondrial n=1 Tax=Strongyloides ratti TaxID=34506 RepID=A0A090LIQ2_STRRB|nr:Protein SCO1 homolog, mitochondrial [Strongyloides ratti]CEF67380.1 Protein SCO1 homolog, mitochondrial [Strongyloides ratti]
MLTRIIKLKPLLKNSNYCLASFCSKKDDIKVDVDIEKLKKELENLKSNDESKSDFMNFTQQQQKKAHERSHIFNWKSTMFTLGTGFVFLSVLLYLRQKRLNEEEKQRQIMAGKARIGGEWELINTEGKLEGSKDLLGNWVLTYFGFTHCPDICPDEIEKMVSVVDHLNKHNPEISIIPVFISVDPDRDTPERVKAYCSEFSPKIRGYTGSTEQIKKVTKTFRIYHSQGPKTAEDDYIVDHTVIMYLIDPSGEFHDYYGQNKSDTEIADIIKLKVLKYELSKKNKGNWL